MTQKKFSLIFFITSFLILSFCINYFPLSFVIFKLFFLFGYSNSRLVKWTRVGSKFFFLYWTLFFLTMSFFWNSFLSRFHITGCEFIKLSQVDSSFFIQYYIYIFIYLFSSLILDYHALKFTIFFQVFSISSYILVNLTILYYHL